MATKLESIKNHEELQSYFQGMNHIDIKTIKGSVDLRQFIAGLLSYHPWWISLLFRIREIFVHLFGLVKHEEPAEPFSLTPESVSFAPGEKATFFIVHKAKEDTYWIAESPPDKHLEAFFGVVTEKVQGTSNRFHVFTSVKYIHWTGPVYFNIIRPFHHLVVWRMMKAGVRH